MFGSGIVALGRDDNALVHSQHMDLHDVLIHPYDHACDNHHTDIVFELEDKSTDSNHSLKLNANHVIKAVEYLEDELGLNRVESETVCNALRLLRRRSKEFAIRRALETN